MLLFTMFLEEKYVKVMNIPTFHSILGLEWKLQAREFDLSQSYPNNRFMNKKLKLFSHHKVQYLPNLQL